MDLQPWIPVFAPVATVAAAAIAARPLYRQLRLKQEEERRLAQASRAEIDARLMTLFVQLMAKAHARGETTIAEGVLQAIVSTGGPLAPKSAAEVKQLIESAVIVYPVGSAEQDAAISAIGELGSRYEVLRRPALAGLENIASWMTGPSATRTQAAIAHVHESEKTV